MIIDEISSPGLRQNLQDPQSRILSQVESSIKELEIYSPGTPLPERFASELRHNLAQLRPLAPFTNSVKLQIWKLSYRLWNACVDLSNASGIKSSGQKLDEEHAKLRQSSAELLYLAGDVSGIPSAVFKASSFFCKTGLIWHDLRKFDLANGCFEKATDLISKVDIHTISDDGEKKLLLDLNIARARTAWEVSDRNLCITLLNRSKHVLFGIAENYRALANEYLTFGKSVLSKSEVSGINEALKLMNEALELCDKGLKLAKRTEETLGLKELRSKTLRFIAASHLQRDEFDSVLKCVRVLRDGGGDQHPSLSVLALKAWLGLGKYAEAEKELKAMVVDKEIPEGVWVSAVESYFQSAGAAGAETTKGVFLGLLGRCHISARAALTVVNKVIGDGGYGTEEARVRSNVVAELVGDERVVALFAGDTTATERRGMHALLWNCGAEHFRSKYYQTSAELFEKSMLYVPHTLENRILRAKAFRVLCLCHLGLSQLDQALEYINEAEKLEHTVACAFLKFKIYLLKNDRDSAISQIQLMSSCLDFTPKFLCLSAHEAIACHSLPVAVASLSHLLKLYSSENPMPTPEVVVLRTLLTILMQDPIDVSAILKYTKHAHARLLELGPERFFGADEVGKGERNWFAVKTWNLGVRNGKEKNYDSAAEFFKLASEFYGVAVNGESQGNDAMVCKSLILTVSATISGERQHKITLTESEVKHAIQLLDRAKKILIPPSAGSYQVASVEPNFFFIYTWNAYDLYGKLADTGNQQLLLIKSYAGSKCCNPKLLLQLGLDAAQGPRSNPEVASFALNESLSALLASPSPDYPSVALILRKLISIGTVHKCENNDDEVIGWYKQAYRIMVGLREGEYPVEEAKWLAMTAWNRASLPVKLGHIDEGKKWMNLGLELAKKVPGMQTYKSCMEDYLVGFEKKFQGNENGQSSLV